MYQDKCVNGEWFDLNADEVAFFLCFSRRGPFPLTAPVYRSLQVFKEPYSRQMAEYRYRLEEVWQLL
jgi:hypothetical protein